MPPLLVAADRVATTVAGGIHGRRRVGVGDSFWQFRPFVTGDALSRIDWRRSARSDRAYVRDTEWEAAQTVWLWRDASPRMDWRSSRDVAEKRRRADLLLLAMAALLFRAGEQVRLAGAGSRTFRGRAGLSALAAALGAGAGGETDFARAPAHARAVLFSDFLGEADEAERAASALIAARAKPHFVQVLDPAELDFPYAGRVRFSGVAGEAPEILPRAERVRGAYRGAVEARVEAVCRAASRAGTRALLHRTDAPPETALLSLYTALAAR